MGAHRELPALRPELLKLAPTLSTAIAVLALAGPALGEAGATPWSAPATLEACPGLEGAQVLFPSDKPNSPTGPGAVVWEASAGCPGGEGVRVATIGAGEVPGTPHSPTASNGQAIAPRGAPQAAVAPHGEILIAGSGGGAPIQGSANGPFAALGGFASTPAPLALTSAYLSDVAVAAPTHSGGLALHVERFYASGIDRSGAISREGGRSAQALTLAMDFRSDAIAVWAQQGSIYARYLPANGRPHPIQRLGAAGAHLRISALLSDDDRAIAAWAEEAHGETSIYLERSYPGVRFATPTLLERFPNPDGLPSPSASPELVRLSSESVMMAWSGASEGRWVVRTAAIDLQGVGTPTTIASPTGDALLAALATGPDGDALVLWTQPQQTLGGAPQLQDQAIFAARGFDGYPKESIFGHPEEVAPPGPNEDPTLALDPAGDGALAVWRGQGGALDYATRTPSNDP